MREMESTTTPEQGPADPDACQPEPIEIPEAKFAFYNRPYNRADLKARQELAKIEATWYHATRAGDRYMAEEMHQKMRECFEFIDPEPERP